MRAYLDGDGRLAVLGAQAGGATPAGARRARPEDARAVRRARRRRSPVLVHAGAHRPGPPDHRAGQAAVRRAEGGADDRRRGRPPRRAGLALGVYDRLPNYRNNWLRLGFTEEQINQTRPGVRRRRRRLGHGGADPRPGAVALRRRRHARLHPAVVARPGAAAGARLGRARGIVARTDDGEALPGAATMADRLALDGDGDSFHSTYPTDERHVFGGLLIGQALRAAQLTVEGRGAHSLHASFIQAGVGGEHVAYDVERTRDGTSFGTRRVVARQSGGVVLVLTADFHRDEDGHDYEEPAVLGVPGPDGLPVGRYASRVVRVARRARRGPACRRAGAGPAGVVPPDRTGARRPAAAPAGAGLPVRPRADPCRPGAARPSWPTTPPASRSPSTMPSGSTARSTSTAGCSASCTPSPPVAAAAWRWARSAPDPATSWPPSPRRSSSELHAVDRVVRAGVSTAGRPASSVRA